MSQEIADHLDLFARLREGMLAAIDGLNVEALDWTPLASDTSSLAMLAHHCVGVLRLWVVEYLTGRDVGRDRAAEFAAKGQDATALAALVTSAFDEATAALSAADPATFSHPRQVTLNHPTRGQMRTAYYGIGYALSHISEHVGHMQLTRQLWEARQRVS